jgi:hypothetical protein
MIEYEHKLLESQLKSFAAKNFVRPSDCRNIAQVKFYVRELCSNIEHYEQQFDYVPSWAYTLLSQYNLVQNKMISTKYRLAYR